MRTASHNFYRQVVAEGAENAEELRCAARQSQWFVARVDIHKNKASRDKSRLLQN